MRLLLLGCALLGLCSGCRDAGQAAPAPVAVGRAPALEKRFFLSDRVVDEAAKAVRFEPERSRQKADYATYQFDRDDYDAVAGAEPQAGAVTLSFVVLSESEAAVPPEPGGPAPAGGVRVKTLRCKLLAVKR